MDDLESYLALQLGPLPRRNVFDQFFVRQNFAVQFRTMRISIQIFAQSHRRTSYSKSFTDPYFSISCLNTFRTFESAYNSLPKSCTVEIISEGDAKRIRFQCGLRAVPAVCCRLKDSLCRVLKKAAESLFRFPLCLLRATPLRNVLTLQKLPVSFPSAKSEPQICIHL